MNTPHSSYRQTKLSRWRIVIGVLLFILLLFITWYVRVHTHHPLWIH